MIRHFTLNNTGSGSGSLDSPTSLDIISQEPDTQQLKLEIEEGPKKRGRKPTKAKVDEKIKKMISDATDASGAQVQRSMKQEAQQSEEGSAEASPDATTQEGEV